MTVSTKETGFQMKRSHVIALGPCLLLGLASSGCSSLVTANVAAGLREGTITAATGIIESFFDERFPLAAPITPEEGGDDRFARL